MKREDRRWLLVIVASVLTIGGLVTVNVLPTSSPADVPRLVDVAAALPRPGVPAPIVGPAIASAVDSLPSTEPTDPVDVPGAFVAPAPVLTGHPSVRTAPRAALVPRTSARPLPAPVRPAGVFFAVCADARAAGVAPIRRGAPGYRPPLDRDSDGLACEIDTPAPPKLARATTTTAPKPASTTRTPTTTARPSTSTQATTARPSSTSPATTQEDRDRDGVTGESTSTPITTSSTSPTRTIVGDPADVTGFDGN